MQTPPISRDKSLKLYPNSYVVLDIETTGFNPSENEIIELSAIKVLNGDIVEEFSKLVKPMGYVNDYIVNLTGITREILENAFNLKEVIKEFNDFCAGSIVIGHNINFDLSFINNALIRYYDIPFNNDYIDTLAVARELLPNLPNKKLGTIAAHFGFNTDGMHRGLKDCIVTNLCYRQFMDMTTHQKTLF